MEYGEMYHIVDTAKMLGKAVGRIKVNGKYVLLVFNEDTRQDLLELLNRVDV